MSNFIPNRPARFNSLQRKSFAIVASQYNAEYVKCLVDSARLEIELLAPHAQVTVYEVPGAFEIPVLLQEIAVRGNLDAIIALGVIIQGETAHADLVGSSVTNALQDIALRFRTPVIHEVLLVKNAEQAAARVGGEYNRGQEAARAAVQISQTLAEYKQRHPITQ